MHSTRPKSLKTVRTIEIVLTIGSIAIGLISFLFVDYLYSYQRRGNPFEPSKPKTNGQSLYISKPSGWYELNKDYDGEDQYGKYIFRVRTDSQGFRIPISQPIKIKNSSDSTSTQRHRAAPPLFFLGDSFTYGVASSWEDSFVGQVAKRYSGEILNAGVNSHSPTPHLYRLNRMIRDGSLPKNARVIMAIDISDVQDEATRWVKTSSEPMERTSSAVAQVIQRRHDGHKSKSTKPFFSPSNFQLTHQIYYGLEAFFKHFFDHWQIRNLSRSAFTHKPWEELDSRYQPLGVQGGLEQIRSRIREAAQISHDNGHEFWLLIYPWPAQISYANRFNWEYFIKKSCQPPNCSGVINAVPNFRARAGNNPSSKDWQEQLYLKGDMHFSPAGNKLVADEILKAMSSSTHIKGTSKN